MSRLRLGSINSSELSIDTNFYLEAVVNSESGFLDPRMIKDSSLVDLFFGDFKFNQSYKSLIDRGLPIMMMGIITPSSKFNRSSLQINYSQKDGKVSYCHPRYGTKYENDDKISDVDTSNGESLNIILDFTDVPEKEYLGNGNITKYCIFQVPYKDSNGNYVTKNALIRYYPDINEHPKAVVNKVPSTYYSGGFEIVLSSTDSTRLSVINAISSKLSEWGVSYLTSVREYEDLVEGAFGHISGNLDESNLEDLISYIKEQRLYTLRYEEVVKSIRMLVESGITDKESIKSRHPDYYRIMIESPYVALRLTNYEDFTGVSQYVSETYNNDLISSKLNNSDKVVTIYSKIHGPAGDKIQVLFEEVDDISEEYRNYHRLMKVVKGDYSEYYKIYTKRSDLSESYGYIPAESVTDLSKLIEIRLDGESPIIPVLRESYENELGYQVTETIPYELGGSSEEYIEYIDYYNTLEILKDYEYYSDLFLCDGLFASHENDQLKSIYEYSVMRYNQALINVDWRYLSSNVSNDIWNYISSKNELNQDAGRKRLLLFYGTTLKDGIEYPTYYHYISHIIYSTLLKIPSEILLYDELVVQKDNGASLGNDSVLIIGTDAITNEYIVESYDGSLARYKSLDSIESLLTQKKVNYLKYNNLYYYYTNLIESSDDQLFIVQFTQSKVSRKLLEDSDKIKGSTSSTISDIISTDLSEVSKLLPYLDSYEYTYEINYRSVTIGLTLTMKTLINTLLTVNYILNLS